MSKLYVPNEILRVLRDYYPDVKLNEVEWSWEIPGKIYEAEFEQYDVSYEVEITVTGHLLLSELSLELEDLPEHIVAAASETFEDHSIEEADMIQYSNGDVSYELSLKNASTGTIFEAQFRDDGLFLLKGEDL